MRYRQCLGCCKTEAKVCVIKYWKHNYHCPCGECLVKPMCEISCNKRERVIEKIINIYKDEEITYGKSPTIPREI